MTQCNCGSWIARWTRSKSLNMIAVMPGPLVLGPHIICFGARLAKHLRFQAGYRTRWLLHT